MTLAFPRRGLYALTPAGMHGAALLEGCDRVLKGGAAAIQYRDKGTDGARRLADARALRGLTRRHGVPFIVNDDPALALACEADGVHLGRDDAAPAVVRRQLGARAIIGVSCYDDPARALAARDAGADYVAFGRFFPSGTKPLASPATVATLAAARPGLGIPVVAIGGINPDNGAALLRAGADLLAVIGALFDAPDPARAAAAFAALFDAFPAPARDPTLET